MSIEISLSGLAKSQLFTLKGEAVSDFSPAGGLDISGARLQQSQSVIRLQNVIIDNKYKILNLLGEGGMGAVYKAHHLMLNKEVALKTFLSPNLTGDSWHRFQREAKAIASLSHINIVHVFDFGVGENNIPYYTMEYLRGESLAERLNRLGPLPPDQAVQIFLQVCQAMAAAHNKGIIHRDLKPANIFLAVEEGATTKLELVKIVDFGIASLANVSVDDQKLTCVGTVFGSPLYMSPEQSMGDETTIRSDIYSCGCALFETLTGSPPFRGKNALETMIQHQQKPVPRLNDVSPETEFPQRLNALLAKMLAKQADQRFQSMNEVAFELESIAQKLSSVNEHDRRDTQSLPRSGESKAEASLRQQSQTGEKSLTLPGKLASLLALAVVLVGAAVFVYFRTNLLPIKAHKDPDKSSKAPQTTTVATATKGKGTGAAPTRPAASESSGKGFPKVEEITQTRHAGRIPTPGDGIPKIRPYLLTPIKDEPHAGRRYLFPLDRSLGSLTYTLIDGHEAHLRITEQYPGQARGAVFVPPVIFMHLTAGQTLLEQPQRFSGFGADYLDTLQFDDHLEWTNDHMRWVGGLTGLTGLAAENLNISDDCLDDIQKLTNLKNLTVGGSNITAKGLLRLNRLTKLVILGASGIQEMRPVLEKLQNSRTLDVLRIGHCVLSDPDMAVISKLPEVTFIELSHNKISDVGLLALAKTPKLQKLWVDSNNITASGCIRLLKQCPRLTELKVDNFSADERHLLEKAFGKIVIFAPGSDSRQLEQ